MEQKAVTTATISNEEGVISTSTAKVQKPFRERRSGKVGGSGKAVGAILAGSTCTILAWAANTYWGATIPDYVQGSIQTLLTFFAVVFIPSKWVKKFNQTEG